MLRKSSVNLVKLRNIRCFIDSQIRTNNRLYYGIHLGGNLSQDELSDLIEDSYDANHDVSVLYFSIPTKSNLPFLMNDALYIRSVIFKLFSYHIKFCSRKWKIRVRSISRILQQQGGMFYNSSKYFLAINF